MESGRKFEDLEVKIIRIEKILDWIQREIGKEYSESEIEIPANGNGNSEKNDEIAEMIEIKDETNSPDFQGIFEPSLLSSNGESGDISDETDFEEEEFERVIPPKRGRGRPRKNPQDVAIKKPAPPLVEPTNIVQVENMEVQKKGRGRPKKVKKHPERIPNPIISSQVPEEASIKPIIVKKRGRGRPRKIPETALEIPRAELPSSFHELIHSIPAQIQTPLKRGRPRKNPESIFANPKFKPRSIPEIALEQVQAQVPSKRGRGRPRKDPILVPNISKIEPKRIAEKNPQILPDGAKRSCSLPPLKRLKSKSTQSDSYIVKKSISFYKNKNLTTPCPIEDCSRVFCSRNGPQFKYHLVRGHGLFHTENSPPKSIHSVLLFICEVCQWRGITKNDLKRHRNKIHNLK